MKKIQKTNKIELENLIKSVKNDDNQKENSVVLGVL